LDSKAKIDQLYTTVSELNKTQQYTLATSILDDFIDNNKKQLLDPDFFSYLVQIVRKIQLEKELRLRNLKSSGVEGEILLSKSVFGANTLEGAHQETIEFPSEGIAKLYIDAIKERDSVLHLHIRTDIPKVEELTMSTANKKMLGIFSENMSPEILVKKRHFVTITRIPNINAEAEIDLLKINFIKKIEQLRSQIVTRSLAQPLTEENKIEIAKLAKKIEEEVNLFPGNSSQKREQFILALATYEGLKERLGEDGYVAFNEDLDVMQKMQELQNRRSQSVASGPLSIKEKQALVFFAKIGNLFNEKVNDENWIVPTPQLNAEGTYIQMKYTSFNKYDFLSESIKTYFFKIIVQNLIELASRSIEFQWAVSQVSKLNNNIKHMGGILNRHMDRLNPLISSSAKFSNKLSNDKKNISKELIQITLRSGKVIKDLDVLNITSFGKENCFYNAIVVFSEPGFIIKCTESPYTVSVTTVQGMIKKTETIIGNPLHPQKSSPFYTFSWSDFFRIL